MNKYRVYYSETANDPYAGTYLPILNEYVTTANQPQDLRNKVYTTGNAGNALSHLLLTRDPALAGTGPGRILAYHRATCHDGRIGRPTPFDGVGYSFLGDVIGNQPPITVVLPDDVFNTAGTTQVPTPARIDQLLGADPTIELLGPFQAGDPDIEAVTVRRIIYAPPKYMLMAMDASLSPQEAWNQIRGAIVTDGKEADCAELINWLRVSLTHKANNDQPRTTVAPPVGQLITDPVHAADFHYSFFGVNDETVRLAPDEAMQFGRALERVLTQIVYANPRYGPIQLIKIDIADDFYRIKVRLEDIPKLGVSFPNREGEDPLVAFLLALPMGWTQSPPYFCAVTETIADVANERLQNWMPPLPHRLDAQADTPGDVDEPPPTTLCEPARNPLLPRPQRPQRFVDVFVDDFICGAQGNQRHLTDIRRVLMQAIDHVFRPLDDKDPSHRRESISVDKLLKGDAAYRDMLLDIPVIADLATLQANRQAIIDKNLLRQNSKRHSFDYAVNGEVLIKTIDPNKMGARAHGPYRITQVYTNGTVDVRRNPHVVERMNIRRLIPFKRWHR